MNTERRTDELFSRAHRSPSIWLAWLAALLTGCSSFHSDWKSAGRQPAAAHEITGRWQGHWTSDTSGHHDKLRCLVTHRADGGYDARYHAKYGKILSFSYTVKLEVEPQGDVFKFHGEANLGKWAGGPYHYEGKATPTNFFCTYQCKSDHGTFLMTRPAPE